LISENKEKNFLAACRNLFFRSFCSGSARQYAFPALTLNFTPAVLMARKAASADISPSCLPATRDVRAGLALCGWRRTESGIENV